MNVYSLVNLKGGSGKTTSTVCLSEAIKAAGYEVLVVDLDPQATLSRWLAGTADHATQLLDGSFDSEEHISVVPPVDVHLIASNRSLARSEDKRAAKLARRLERLFEAIEGFYDYVLIDPPPSVGSLVLAALMASDGVLAPVEASAGAVDGFTDTLGLMRRTGGAQLQGAFACRVDVRTNSDMQVPRLLTDEFGPVDGGGKAFRTFIRETVKMREAQTAHSYPSRYDPGMTAVLDYNAVALELLRMDGFDEPSSDFDPLPGWDQLTENA
jgi:chromosome partitioning protein